MNYGKRLKQIRKMKGLTQKELGVAAGFSEKTAVIRIGQYESGSRKPKEELIKKFASILNVAPEVLNIPTLNNHVSILHTLFFLEDIYGLKIKTNNKEPGLFIEDITNEKSAALYVMMIAWASKAAEYEAGNITKEEYDLWRYSYTGQKNF